MNDLIVYLRITYGLQLMATTNFLLALFLPWHSTIQSPVSVVGKLLAGSEVPFQYWQQLTPLWLLLLLLPVIIISIMRSLMGVFENHRIGWLTVARRAAYAALASVVWFYFSSPDIGGRLQFGYWLTTFSLGLLAVLLLIESSMPADFRQPVYADCPNCGEANPPRSRRCRYCGVLLFPEV